MGQLCGKPLDDVKCQNSKLYAMWFLRSTCKETFRLPWQSHLSTEWKSFSDFVELHARNMLSFIQFRQVGKRKMFQQMFDALWTLCVTIAHVDSLVRWAKIVWNDWSFSFSSVYFVYINVLCWRYIIHVWSILCWHVFCFPKRLVSFTLKIMYLIQNIDP